jgi:hypothetical protein
VVAPAILTRRRARFQTVLDQAEPLLTIQGELDHVAGGPDEDRGLGWLGLVGILSLRIGSFPGGSSVLVKGKATSSLATGREEPSSSLFNLRTGQSQPLASEVAKPLFDRLRNHFNT